MRKGQGRTMHARTTTRGVLSAALAVLFTLVGTSAASAVVPGGLITPAVPAQCAVNGGAGGCVNAHNLPTGAPPAIAMSPDSANVYVAGTDGSAYSLVSFARNPANGQLTQLGGTAGGIRSAAAANCATTTPVLNNPTAIAITPDGSSVYVGDAGSSQILEFDRGAGGALSLKSTPCIANSGGPGQTCVDADALGAPQDLAVAGSQLYAASSNPGAVTALQINAGGVLTQLSSPTLPTGCVSTSILDGCQVGKGLLGATSIAVSGGRVYVASRGGRTISVLARDESSGLIRQSAASDGCIAQLGGVCSAVADLNGNINGIATSGSQLYASLSSGRVLVLDPTAGGLAR